MSKPISLTSSNGESFSIDEKTAKLSLRLKTIIDRKDDLVKDISSITLSKVIEYCSKHVPNNDADEEALKLFDEEFVNSVDKVGLLYLVEAAKDLKIKGLYDLCRESLVKKLAVSGSVEILQLLTTEDLNKSVKETLSEVADQALGKRCSSGCSLVHFCQC